MIYLATVHDWQARVVGLFSIFYSLWWFEVEEGSQLVKEFRN